MMRDVSRRNFLRFAASSSAVLAMPIFSEASLAAAAAPNIENSDARQTVYIDKNENPLGPSLRARQAIVEMVPHGGRYNLELTQELVRTFCELNDLPADHVRAFAGSSAPLQYSVLTFTSPSRSYVTADPGYEAGMQAAKVSRARVVKVPLAADYAHDIPAMLRAAPDAGIFYICNPNNPSGTMTPRAQIEFLLAHKPANSIVMVDEAYYHFADMHSCLDLTKAGKDIIVLRTFSKVYGMAGLRCGFAVARPEILAKIYAVQGWNPLSTVGVAAAIASLREENLVAERKKINTDVRTSVFEWLQQQNYSYIPSQTNFFIVDTKRNGKSVVAAMAAKGVRIGRMWPVWPQRVRVTVGTPAEMARFQNAYRQVMQSSEEVLLENLPRDFHSADWRSGFVS
jgi:histidinol-phosphate aminotransferase